MNYPGADKCLDGRRRILVLYWHPVPLKEMRTAIRQHLHVLDHSDSKHEVLYYNAVDGAPAWLRHCAFDAVVLHTTFLCLRWSHHFYGWKWKLRWVRDLDCVKIALPQDEYDHAEILDEWLFEWGVSIIFSNFADSARKVLYPLMHDRAVFYECFTGYIDDSNAAPYQGQTNSSDRPYDIVYRATHLPYWFGRHGQLKQQIAEIVAKRAVAHGLGCDISTREQDTIVGDEWLKFLASGRTVIGCESGSSVLDRRGEIRAWIQALQRTNPSIQFEEIADQMPKGWDDYRFFAISPRHFEAIFTKTCQVLVEGRYNGILEAEKHYIPLKRDFSNIEDVLEKVRDHHMTQAVADRAYEDIYLSGRYTYRTLAADIERALHGNDDGREDSLQVLGLLLWPLARIRTRLATEGANAHVRYERLKQSIMSS